MRSKERLKFAIPSNVISIKNRLLENQKAQIIMSINDSMTQFRLASRELFNTYFRVDDPYSNDGWQLEERFSLVESELFDQLVGAPSTLAFDSYGRHQLQISVSLQQPIKFCPIMINREIDGGYWDFPVVEVTNEAKLSFVRFFDWDSLAVRDNKYVRVRIDAWSIHPEVVGKHALIDANSVVFDEEKADLPGQ